MIGQTVSHYEIVRLLGKGGMGFVYEAVDKKIEKRAAIKILKAEFFGNADVAARFRNEARAVNIVQHPGLVSIFEFGEMPDGGAFIVMEYLQGETLAQRLKRLGRLEEAIVIGRQICSALCAAHAKQIVHRDLKPANIMLIIEPEFAGGERVKILDFGIAKLMEPQGTGQPSTRTGMIMGSPGYMAPEQYRNVKAVDERSDVYSLGVILFEMLAGRPPFVANNDADLMAAHMYKEPADLKDLSPDVRPAVAAFVLRMLSKQSKDRPTSLEVLRFLNQQAGLPGGMSMPHEIVKSSDKPAAPAAAEPAPANNDGATDYGPTGSASPQPASGPGEKTVTASEAPTRVSTKRPDSSPADKPSVPRAAKSKRPFVIAALIAIVLLAAGLGVRHFRAKPATPPPIPAEIPKPPADVKPPSPPPPPAPAVVEPPAPIDDKRPARSKSKEHRRHRSKER